MASARTGDGDDERTVPGQRIDVTSFAFGLLAGTLTMVVGNLVGVFELIGAAGGARPSSGRPLA